MGPDGPRLGRACMAAMARLALASLLWLAMACPGLPWLALARPGLPWLDRALACPGLPSV
jgi:hypothetical protein